MKEINGISMVPIPGDYTVQTKNDCGLSAMSEIFVLSVTGVEEEISKAIRVYPNPTDGKLYIEVPLNVKCQGITLINVNGQIELGKASSDQSTIELNVGSLTKGLYILQIQTLNQIIYKKILIK
jgi:bacillolysin